MAARVKRSSGELLRDALTQKGTIRLRLEARVYVDRGYSQIAGFVFEASSPRDAAGALERVEKALQRCTEEYAERVEKLLAAGRALDALLDHAEDEKCRAGQCGACATLQGFRTSLASVAVFHVSAAGRTASGGR
jgi:hypothetical protein